MPGRGVCGLNDVATRLLHRSKDLTECNGLIGSDERSALDQLLPDAPPLCKGGAEHKSPALETCFERHVGDKIEVANDHSRHRPERHHVRSLWSSKRMHLGGQRDHRVEGGGDQGAWNAPAPKLRGEKRRRAKLRIAESEHEVVGGKSGTSASSEHLGSARERGGIRLAREHAFLRRETGVDKRPAHRIAVSRICIVG